MRLPNLLLTAAAIGCAAATALAQDTPPPPAEPPAEANPPPAEPPATGLSDLQQTVQGLEDETPPAEAAPAEAAPPAEAPPAESPPPPPAEARPPAAEAPPPASPPSRPPPPLTRAQNAALASAVARGRLLGVIAAAGQVATQDMLSRVPDPDGAGITGWIAQQEGNGVTVTFYADPAAGADGGALTVYRVTILGGRIQGRDVFLAGTRPPLGPIEARMAAARATTESLDHQVCGGDAFNVFVVPPETAEGPIDVYQISPQSQRGHYPLGGHFKTTVAADGHVSASRGYTNACLDTLVAPVAEGARGEPIAITYLMDPLPTEIHVFLSLWTRHPLVVVAGDPQRLFAVTPDSIAEIPR